MFLELSRVLIWGKIMVIILFRYFSGNFFELKTMLFDFDVIPSEIIGMLPVIFYVRANLSYEQEFAPLV